MKQDKNPEKLYIEAFASYMEGCTLVSFSKPAFEGGASLLFQESANPTIYNKLSCHLPWIAEQYDMDFDAGDTDLECTQATGDLSEGLGDGECRCACWSESLCIFPFYWEGKYYDQCNMLEHDGFLIRIFRCPIYNTVNKINGTNSYTYADLILQQDAGGICPAEGTNPYNSSVIPTVDPSYQDCDSAPNFIRRLTPLVPCKNNCRGVAGVTIV